MPRLSEQQKRDRRQGLGASDIAELLGISPYERASPVRLFAEKAGLEYTDPDEEEEQETIEQRVGHALEGALVRLYEQESNREVETMGAFVESVVRPDPPWARCNLDARIKGARIGLEIKVVGIGMAGDWDLGSDDGIPHYVRTQVAWQMFVADLDAVHVVSLVGGTAFRVFYIDRDRALEELLFADARAFWLDVIANKAPALDATSSSREYLEELYPSPPNDVEIDVRDLPEVVAIGERRVKAAEAESRAVEAKELAGNELREAMGKLGATVAWCGSWRATWRKSKNGARPLVVKRVASKDEPRVRKIRATAANPPVIDDGEVF